MFFSFRGATGSDDLRRPRLKSERLRPSQKAREISKKTEAARGLINVTVYGVF
jgi:hypothetical protein